MVNALSPTDVNVQSTQQIVDTLGIKFGKLAQLVPGNTEAQQLLDDMWKGIQQLERVNHSMDAIVMGAQAALEKLARQRDSAVIEAKHWKRAGEELAKEIIAGKVAYDGDIPIKDVMLVLDVLSGDKTTFEEPRLEELFEAIRDLGNALLEEQLFETASREIETED